MTVLRVLGTMRTADASSRLPQYGLRSLLLCVAVVSLALASFRLPEPINIAPAMLIGSFAGARLGKSYGETVLLGMYGSIAGVWIAALGRCLVTWSLSLDWATALLASWLCLPLGILIGVVVATRGTR